MVSTTDSYRSRAQSSGYRAASMVSILFAGSIGTIIEWYDFLIYGTAAALVFKSLFFPTFDPLTGTLASLGTYAVGFLGRPLGAALFGHFGGGVSLLLIGIALITLIAALAARETRNECL